MKRNTIALLVLTAAASVLRLPAAVPLSWTVETSRVDPAVFDAYQGETLTFEAALQSHGKPLEAPVNYSFFWQTNGMGSTYWEAPAQRGIGVSPLVGETNVLFATWLPAYDVGARAYNCFIGSPSNIYHAAFQLRLRPSPGATPNALPLPTPVIDFARVRVLNPPWGSGGGGGCETNAVDALANSAVVTNALTVATTNRVAALETATNNLSSSVSSLASSVSDISSSVSGLASSKADRSYIETVVLPSVGDAHNLAESANQKVDSIYPVAMDASQKAYESVELLSTKADIMMISATNPTFSNEVAAVARTVTPPPSPTLRLYDEVRQCYWIGRMINGVINWEVE